MEYHSYVLKSELSKFKIDFDELFHFTSIPHLILNKFGEIVSFNLSAASFLKFRNKSLLNHFFSNFITLHSQINFNKQIKKAFEIKINCKEEYELILENKQVIVQIDILPFKNDHLLLVLHDLSEYKKLEQDLINYHKSLFLFQNIFQNRTDAVAILDTEYHFKIFNLAFIEAFSQIFTNPINTKTNFLLYISDYPELKDNITNACKKALQNHTSIVRIENDWDNEDVYYCYDLHFSLLKNFENNLTLGIIFTIKNIREQKLKQRDRSKQNAILINSSKTIATIEMAAAFAHEINQPLAALNIYANSCINQFTDTINANPKLLKGLKQIVLITQHAGEILHRMKNFMHYGELCFEKTDINLLIKQSLTFFDHIRQQLKFDIELHLNDSLPLIDIDKIKITQVILNLIQNSIEAFHNHTDKKLIIKIESTILNNDIEIRIKDNGPGIPNEIIDKIMKSYFTTKSQGTGLGLAICRTLIKAHNGNLIISPQNGIGANIYFSLPLNNVLDKSHEK